MAKWGWALHFSDSSHDMDYTDAMEEPYDSEEEAYEAAEEASSSMHLGFSDGSYSIRPIFTGKYHL